jgi:hypothetical protein
MSQAPTVLSIDPVTQATLWGWEVLAGDPKLETFKLGLCPEAARETSWVDRKYAKAFTRKLGCLEKNMQYTTTYLTSISPKFARPC